MCQFLAFDRQIGLDKIRTQQARRMGTVAHLVEGVIQCAWQLTFAGVGVAVKGRRGGAALLHTCQPRCKCGSHGKVGVGISTGQSVFHPAGGRCAVGHTQTGGAVVVPPLHIHRGLAARHVASVGVDVGRVQRHEVGRVGLQTANEVHKPLAGRAISVTEDVLAAGHVFHALVQVHGAARLARHRFGHEHGVQTVAQRHLFGRVLEQKSLVSRSHRVAVHEVDFVLALAHFMKPGVGAHTQLVQSGVEFVPERGQLVEHVHAEGRLPHLGTPTPTHGYGQRLHGVGDGGSQVKLDFRCHHGPQTQRVITDHYGLEDGPRSEWTQLACQIDAIVHRHIAWDRRPGHPPQSGHVRHQAHVWVTVRKNRMG